MNTRDFPIPFETARRRGASIGGNHTNQAISHSLATLARLPSRTKGSIHRSTMIQETCERIKNFARSALWKFKRPALLKAKGPESSMPSGNAESGDQTLNSANDEKYQSEIGSKNIRREGVSSQQSTVIPESYSVHPSLNHDLPSQKPSPVIHKDDIIDGCYWGSVLRIGESAVTQLVWDLLHRDNNRCGSDCQVENIEQGSYNRAFVVRVGTKKYVLRVPRFGVKGVWNEHDEIELRSQALSMKWIKRNLDVPIPEVLAYDVSHDNIIHHPYILMSHLPGKRVCDVWGGQYGPELEQKRKRILENIAQTVTELSYFTFSKSGMFYFDDENATRPKVVQSYEILQDDISRDGRQVLHKTRLVKPTTSSYQEFRHMIQHWWKRHMNDDKCVREDKQLLHLLQGQKEILQILIDCLPSSPSKNNTTAERFVIAPPDFNWQNILVDEEGEVTGLLDWDSVRTTSRFLGWSALPLWLTTDYTEEVIWTGRVGCSPALNSEYRHHYAEAISRTTDGQGDSRYTQKSVLFRALVEALRCREKTLMILEKILQLVLPRVSIKKYLIHIGKEGFSPEEREHLGSLLNEMFECVPGTDPKFSI